MIPGKSTCAGRPVRTPGEFWLAATLLTFGLPTALATTCPDDYQAGQLDHWAPGTVFYQVFVRSFQDSDGDGVGDFNGLTSRLDYLNDGDPDTDTDLGVDAIWMLPITESPSYHGYDTTDYDRVDPDYGTDADFDRLVVEAHRRGLKVMMDLVVNHASAQHPWFIDADRSVESPYHDWFVWREEDPGWTQPWSGSPTWHRSKTLPLHYYGLFWGGMPDLNFENPAVRAEMIAIAKRWLARGVDGFRLDASRHIIEAGEEAKAGGSPETHDWWLDFAAAIREEYPDVILVGENWTTVDQVSEFFGTGPFTELDMNFNFDLSSALVGAVQDDTPGLIQYTVCEVAGYYPPHAIDAIFLTNHDMIRVMTQLRTDPDRARLAASFLLTLPGVPFIYYGEEIGLVNGPGDEDPEKRTPMLWDADGGFTTGTAWKTNRKADPVINVAQQQADPFSLWWTYRNLIRLRHEHAALGRGGYQGLEVAGAEDGKVVAYMRMHDDEKVLAVANVSADPLASTQIELTVEPGTRFGLLLPSAASARVTREGVVIEELPARHLALFLLDDE